MEWNTAPGPAAPLPRQRELIWVILLAIFTLGIYTLYWLYTTYRDTHEHIGRSHKATPALVLAIISLVVMWVSLAVYFVTALGLGAAAETGAMGLFIGGFIGSIIFLLLASLASAAIQVWMMWGAARGAELVLERYGRKPDIPPIVHTLVPIVLNVWVYVAIGLIQSDINKLHATAQRPAPQAYPQA